MKSVESASVKTTAMEAFAMEGSAVKSAPVKALAVKASSMKASAIEAAPMVKTAATEAAMVPPSIIAALESDGFDGRRIPQCPIVSCYFQGRCVRPRRESDQCQRCRAHQD